MLAMNSSKRQTQKRPIRRSGNIAPKLVSVGIKLLILAWLSNHTAQADECVKQVFNRYCLGGDVSVFLATQASPPKAILQDNGNSHYRLQNDGKTIILTTHDNTITAVTRHETPGDWINYTAWKVKLVRLYGRGQDLSDFPRYASSRSSRLNALNAGKGHAEFTWDQQNHLIKLVWDSPDFIKLTYQLSMTQAGEPENSEGL